MSAIPRRAAGNHSFWIVCVVAAACTGTPAGEPRALHDAAVRACSGVAPEDRDRSPFEGVEITSVRLLRSVRRVPGRGLAGTRPAGAVVAFRHAEGATIASLQRWIDCHLARKAALGPLASDLPACPLLPRRVSARVSRERDGFAVAIRSRDARIARDVMVRARRLLREPPA